MKHLFNDLNQTEKNRILEMHKALDNRINIKEQQAASTNPATKLEGRNNPNWKNLVSKLSTLSYTPKVLTFNSYGTPSIPSQSLNWGTAKSPNGKYALSISSSDPTMPEERMSLFNDKNRQIEQQMYDWWSKKGYGANLRLKEISINFKDADKLKNDIESFFKIYPPQ